MARDGEKGRLADGVKVRPTFGASRLPSSSINLHELLAVLVWERAVGVERDEDARSRRRVAAKQRTAQSMSALSHMFSSSACAALRNSAMLSPGLER